MNFLKKIIPSASCALKNELPDDDFLEIIRNTQGIFYNKNKAIFTLTESLPEIKFRQIIYWLRKDDYKKNFYSGIESILITLFEKIHQKDFFINWARESRSSRFAYLLPGADIFCGFDPSPAFWLEWEIFFTIIDPIKAQSNYFWCNPYSQHESIINKIIDSIVSKYMLEVGDEDSCSPIYERQSIYGEKNKEGTPEPKYEMLDELLVEAAKEINLIYREKYGMEGNFFADPFCQPFEQPCLGLWKIKKDMDDFTKAKTCEQIAAKFKKPSEEKKQNAAENNKESPTIESKAKKEVNIFPDKPQDEQIQIYPLCSYEEFKETKKLVRLLLKFLLERDIQNECVHWLYGFVIFHSWRKKTNRMVTDPAGTFDDYISLLNGFGEKEGLWEIKRKKKDKDAKHEKENLKFKNSGFSSNLFEAHNLYKKAIGIADPLKKKEELIIAWQKYPDSIDINLSLTDCWVRESFEGVNDKTTDEMLKFFGNKDYNYSEAYKVINKKRKEKGNMYYWNLPTVREVIREILEESEKFKKYVRILEYQRSKKGILSPDELEYEELRDLILLITEDKDAEPGDITFEQLIKNSTILSVINIVKSRVQKERFLKLEVAQKIIEPAVKTSLWVITAENRINFNKLTALNELKNWLISTLVQEIENQINDGSLPVEFGESRSKKRFEDEAID